MSNKKLISIILTVIIGCSLIIILPIQIIAIHLSSYDTIHESCSFIYQPSSPSSIENLYLNADEGNIEIRYVDPSVDYYVLIEVDIELIGKISAEKSYEDYLNISWYNSSSTANFRLEIISDDWFNPSLWLIKDISIIVRLREDIVFDINTNLIEGNYEITVPWAVSIRNLLTNVSNGNILYNFEFNSIQGNMTGITNKGDFELKSHNVEYTQNCRWDINVEKGNVNIEIYQDRDMVANTTSLVKVNEGEVFILYEDNSAEIGALLEVPYGDPFMNPGGFPGCITNILNLTCTQIKGFDYDMIEPYSEEGIVYFISFDLLANLIKNYYNMRFEIFDGSFAMSLLSVP